MSHSTGARIGACIPLGSRGVAARVARAIAPVAAALVCALALHPMSAAGTAGIAPCEALRAPATPRTDASVVLIVNDAMRADRMSAYGGPARTPNFAAFAAANLRFQRAVTHATWTKPSIATLFTGLLPTEHGLLEHPQWRGTRAQGIIEADVLADEFVTLPEILRANGIRTGGFVANPWVERRFGFSQGFDVWDDSFAAWGSSGRAVNDAVRTWLDTLAEGERFFVYIHYIDSHRPYGRLEPEEVATARDRIEADPRTVPVMERTEIALTTRLTNGRSIVTGGATLKPLLVEMAYHRGIEDFDRVFGDLLAILAARPDWNRTAVIVTSDHGEALFDRGYGNHGRALYQDEVAVPLAARLPGVRARATDITCPTGLVDLMPTLCDYLGIACPGEIAGNSLLSREDRPPSRFLIVEGVHGHPSHRAVVGERYKLIYEPNGRVGPGFVRDPEQGKAHPSALYDLREDPGEGRDLLLDESPAPEVEAARREMVQVMEELANRPRRAPELPATTIDPALAERLRELGYLAEDPSVPDPSGPRRGD
jgi:arylsulfatase A-like enzyme